MLKNKKKLILSILVGLNIVFNLPIVVYAQSSSANYKIEEYYFGTGGEVDASSSSYRARQGTGSLGVGSTSSTNYDAEAGLHTQSEPFLEMAVTGATVSLGNLNSSATSFGAAQAGACNCSFYVKTYLSQNYVVYTISQPPTSESGNNLDAKATTGAPGSGDLVEEFGMNVVFNDRGADPDIGANPVNQPNNTFADGEAAPGYELANQYKYNPGDTIARSQATPSNPAIGLTEYTISYIAKPSINTPAGFYEMNHTLVVVATY